MCLRFTSKEHKKDASLGPDEVSFLNPNSLQTIDEMFFRLPFPDSQRMEKVHERAGVQQDVATFLGEMQSDLAEVRAMLDLRRGWIAYIEQYLADSTDASGHRRPPVNPCRRSSASRRAACRTPTPSSSDDEAGESASNVRATPSLWHIRICRVPW